MIFVTVGTHEQPFNRLVEYMDQLAMHIELDDEVIIQIGYSTYKPKYCTWQRLFPYQEMIENVAKARIVITHGGPSSFIMPLQIGKIPIVVPRQKKFGEHVNDHQMDFCMAVSERQGNIIVVEDIGNMKNTILKYDSLIKNMRVCQRSNNTKFNEEFEKLVQDLFRT